MRDERQRNLGRQARARSSLRMHVRENWYRDVWLFVLSVLMLLSIMIAYHANRDRIADVQQSRMENCERQNLRHDKAYLLASRGDVRNRELVQALIDAVVPVQNCQSIITPPSTKPTP